MQSEASYLFFAAFFFAPLAFFAIEYPPLQVMDCASVTPQHRSALCRLARWPGCRRPRALANSRLAGEQSREQKNWGAPSEHP